MATHIKKRVSMTKREKTAMRERSIAGINSMLAAGAKTAVEMAAVLRIHPTTCYGYLHVMEVGPRTIRKTGQRRAGCVLWELGADMTLPPPDDLLDKAFSKRQRTVPAKQIGMWRDGLVACLFGPAGAGAVAGARS